MLLDNVSAKSIAIGRKRPEAPLDVDGDAKFRDKTIGIKRMLSVTIDAPDYPMTATFTSLTVGSLTGLIKGTAGVLSAIAAGTSSQYLRGDLTMQTLNQAAVAGLTTSDSPTFAALTVSGTFSGGGLYINADQLYKATLSGIEFLSDGKVRVNLVGASPAFQIGTSLAGLVQATAGVLSAIAAGTSAQYLRGDLTMQTLNQAAVAGLTTSDSPQFTGLSGISGATFNSLNVGGADASKPFMIAPQYTGTSWSYGAVTIRPASANPNLICTMEDSSANVRWRLDKYGNQTFYGGIELAVNSAAIYRAWDKSGGAAAWVAGTPVYIAGANSMAKAKADAAGTSDAVGLIREGNNDAYARTALVGILYNTTANWDTITGETGGLTVGAVYYVSPATAGAITKTKPSTPGQFVKRIGVAVATTAMIIDCSGDPVAL